MVVKRIEKTQRKRNYLLNYILDISLPFHEMKMKMKMKMKNENGKLRYYLLCFVLQWKNQL